MSNKLLWKTITIIVLLGMIVFYLYPNFVWYSLPLVERHAQARKKNPLAQKVIPLGLDLQGGVHLVYQIDTSKLPDLTDESVRQAVEQNILVIGNRIDALGVTNAILLKQGREFIVIQLPGVYESEAAKRLIGKTALLEFRIVVDDNALVDILEELRKENLTSQDVIHQKLPEKILNMIPEGTRLLPTRDEGYFLVKDKADMTGKYLKQARVRYGSGLQMGGLYIEFELDSEGAKLFSDLTAAHVNEKLAIVLDDVIQSAPNINERIPHGRGNITGTFSKEEAKDLANVLNSGNLNAPMFVVEERTVGPQMGEDSIEAGMKAILLGFVLVILFMVAYYKVSGLLADIALFVNLIGLAAFLSGVKATLTLPGIAGVILSLAMAVDANVLILERIREELAKGKQVRFAVDEGYSKALSAILDGNITTILAALFLFQFGSGPVKGFGITLSMGLCISMITAVFLTKVFYEIWFSIRKPQKLSI